MALKMSPTAESPASIPVALRVNASLHYAADAGNEIRRRRDSDNAGRSADDVHHVVGAATGADGVPVGVEGADGDRDACFQAELLGPERR